MRTTVMVLASLVTLAGCGTGLGEDDQSGTAETCEGPLGAPIPAAALTGMTACCQADAGNAHCLANDKLPDELKPFVAACDAASSCIPDSFLTTGAAEPPTTCTAFGGQGVCLSICIPQVSENQGLLRKDTCLGADELCVPCISPIDQMPTGACDLLELATCVGEGGDITPPPSSCDDPATCNYDATCPAVIDPTALTACGADAHCVDAALIPAESAAQLGKCTDNVSLCVPDVFITTGGKFTPASCTSINAAEGRCLSTVLPDVKAQQDLLPQATCAASERCTPCYSPIDGTSTGACSQSCDVGPTQPAKPFANCCSGRAKCVPSSAIPDDQEAQLGEDSCQTDGDLCVPTEILNDGPFPACTASSLILGSYTGVCLSDCLEFGFQGLALAKGSCASNFKCAPCTQNGQPTGAPGCPP